MQRGLPLGLLAVVFAVVVVALGRLKGLLALAGIVISMGVLLVFIFPDLLDGSAPVAVALTGATVIAFATLLRVLERSAPERARLRGIPDAVRVRSGPRLPGESSSPP